MFCQCIHPTPPKKTQLIWKTFQCEPQRCIAACPLTNFVVNNVKVSCQRSDGCFSVRSDVESRRPAVRRRPGCFHCHEFDSLWINHLFFLILFSRAWQANVRKIIRLLVVRAICFFHAFEPIFACRKKIIDEKVIGPGVVGRRAFNHTRKFFLHVWRCVRA